MVINGYVIPNTTLIRTLKIDLSTHHRNIQWYVRNLAKTINAGLLCNTTKNRSHTHHIQVHWYVYTAHKRPKTMTRDTGYLSNVQFGWLFYEITNYNGPLSTLLSSL